MAAFLDAILNTFFPKGTPPVVIVFFFKVAMPGVIIDQHFIRVIPYKVGLIFCSTIFKVIDRQIIKCHYKYEILYRII